MTTGTYSVYTPSFRRHVSYPATNLYGHYQSTVASSYGQASYQSQWYAPYNYGGISYPLVSTYTNAALQPAYPGSPATPVMYAPQAAQAVYLPGMAATTSFKGLMVSPRGLEAILISILILVALDLLLVRPRKYPAGIPQE